MKIIKIDNFDRENVDDVLIAENVKEPYACCFVDFLNKKYSRPNASWFYVVVSDDYKLHVFDPNR